MVRIMVIIGGVMFCLWLLALNGAQTSGIPTISGPDIIELVGWLLVVTLYFLPVIVAWKRSHRNALAILVLTFCLGWTVLGWIVALIWSATDNVSTVESRL